MWESLVRCAGVIVMSMLIFGFILMVRYLSYRETLALADKGLVRPSPARGNDKDTLRWGIVIAALGLALSIGLWPLGLIPGTPSFPLGFGPWMLIGLLPLFFGLALILIYVLTHENKPADQQPETKPVEPQAPGTGG
jgi:hypothetical protein